MAFRTLAPFPLAAIGHSHLFGTMGTSEFDGHFLLESKGMTGSRSKDEEESVGHNEGQNRVTGARLKALHQRWCNAFRRSSLLKAETKPFVPSAVPFGTSILLASNDKASGKSRSDW